MSYIPHEANLSPSNVFIEQCKIRRMGGCWKDEPARQPVERAGRLQKSLRRMRARGGPLRRLSPQHQRIVPCHTKDGAMQGGAQEAAGGSARGGPSGGQRKRLRRRADAFPLHLADGGAGAGRGARAARSCSLMRLPWPPPA